MIAFPGMLVSAAAKAGMKVPPDPNNFEEVKNKYPHFFVFCVLQLERTTVYHGEHFANAKIIAAIPRNKVLKMTLHDFLAEGISWAQ